MNKNSVHFRQKADRTCEEDVPLSQPRVASSAEAGTGAGAVIAAVLCILALIVISILGVTFVRYTHHTRLTTKMLNSSCSCSGDFAYYQD